MPNKDTTARTIGVALALCIFCSVIVSTAAVKLKPLQVANKALDVKRNILSAAGLLDESMGIEEQFGQITTRLVDLNTGKFIEDIDGGIDKYNQRKASKDPAFSSKLDNVQDLAKIKRRVDVAKIYVVENGSSVEKVILPIKGYGLWSTLYGFLALDADLNTVIGMGFYEHGETPGLGGEVDNPNWKKLWIGKEVYSEDGDVALNVIKGVAKPSSKYDVDGLSGATLTSRGVSNLVHFWMGKDGFANFLNNLKKGDA